MDIRLLIDDFGPAIKFYPHYEDNKYDWKHTLSIEPFRMGDDEMSVYYEIKADNERIVLDKINETAELEIEALKNRFQNCDISFFKLFFKMQEKYTKSVKRIVGYFETNDKSKFYTVWEFLNTGEAEICSNADEKIINFANKSIAFDYFDLFKEHGVLYKDNEARNIYILRDKQ